MTEKEIVVTGIKQKARIELASITGFVAFVVSSVLMIVGLSLYKRLALLIGFWNEPTLDDVFLAWLIVYLVALIIGVVVRWLLVYKWVAR